MKKASLKQEQWLRCKLNILQIFRMIHIRNMEPSPFLYIPCFPNIKFPAVITLQQVYDTVAVTVKKSCVLPSKLVILTKRKTGGTDNITKPMVPASSGAEEHSLGPGWFNRVQTKF